MSGDERDRNSAEAIRGERPVSDALVFVPHGQARSSRAAMDWLREGWAQFVSNPMGWIGAALVVCLVSALVSSIPVVGDPVCDVVDALIAGGIALGCNRRSRGEHFRFADLSSGLARHSRPLVLMGAAVALAWIAYVVVAVRLLGALGIDMTVSQALDYDLFEYEIPQLLVILVVLLSGAVLIGMAYWFAPSLITLYDQPPLTALAMSFQASQRNMWPLTILGLLFVGVFVLATIPLFVGWLIAVPLWLTVGYASTIDVFEAPRSTQ